MNQITLMTMALLGAAPVYSMDGEEKELVDVFSGQLVCSREANTLNYTPNPTPPLPPVTPTTWEGLATALMAPYYTQYYMCLGTSSIPFFVDRLKAIEEAGTSKAKILDKQLEFVGSTWKTWTIWEGQANYIRYPLIYNFLVARSEQSRSWWDVCCPSVLQYVVLFGLLLMV